MDMNQYLDIFIEESKEHLQSLNESLLKMENDPGDLSLINEIFRVAHTLKGMSGTMGFTRMAKLTHDMENVLSVFRNGEKKMQPDHIDVLFECLDALESYVTMVEETQSEGLEDNAGLISKLNKIIDDGSPREDTAQQAAKTPADMPKGDRLVLNEYDVNVINKAADMGNNAFEITIKLNKGCVLKSARAFIIFKAIEKNGEIIKSEPKVQDIEDEKFDFEFTLIVLSEEDSDVLSKELYSIAEVDEVIINLVKEKNKDAAAKAAASAENAASDKAGSGFDDKDKLHAGADNQAKKSKVGKTVRVDIGRLDVLLNLVSELIIQKTRLEGLEGIVRTPEYVETLEYLEKITSSLHDSVMKVRMVPVETVFNRFPRMVRDLAKDLGKEIILTMSGEETELDRTVIDEIGDPLVHLLRNSCDHGIEPADQREAAGKPKAGNVALRAYQEGSNVVIEVEDDGHGINTENVLKKAIERGIVDKESAAALSQKEIINFLFLPSFSTAEKVTDVSGRGVGLDVVRSKIEAVGGSVEVESELGKGSKFIIRLPLTLAIIQALLVQVGDEKYAIQLSSIQKIANFEPEALKMVQKQEVIIYRDTIIPIVRLDKVLKVPEGEEVPKSHKLVIVKKGDRLTGFVVDRIIGQREIVQKSLGKLLSGVKGITSATILGDGNVALILDINALAH